MSQRIFTNGEDGKILTSVGNRIIKQPYEFGNAFQNRMALNNYILINNISLTLIPSTEVVIIKDVSSDLSEGISTRKSVSNNNYQRIAYNTGSYLTKNSSPSSPANSIFGTAIGFVQQNVNFLYCALASTTSGILRNNGGSALTTPNSTYFTDNDTIAIIVGAYKDSITTGTTPTNVYTNAINRYSIFSRALSLDEINYHYNNKIGNDYQSVLGLEIDLKFNYAEVINISGVDQPCVRDYSGNNRHGIIMNLPAGTAQQKVDYANTNLFVPFI